jgi:PTS system nitrogen regulatory IIA component
VQLTIQQAAELLCASESQVRKWIRSAGLPAVVFNEQYRLNRLDVLTWAQVHQITVQNAVSEPGTGTSLADALARGGIHRDVPGTARAEVVRAAMHRMRTPPGVDRDLLLEMVMARQAQGDTALGNGIALPHARYPNIHAVPEPILALAFLQTPVDFGAADGVPVTGLFTLVAPTTRAHLELLARLARALSGQLLTEVQSRADDAEVLAAARAADVAAEGKQR